MIDAHVNVNIHVHVHVLYSHIVIHVLGDCLTSRPEGCLQPRELWFSIYSCTSRDDIFTPSVHAGRQLWLFIVIVKL